MKQSTCKNLDDVRPSPKSMAGPRTRQFGHSSYECVLGRMHSGAVLAIRFKFLYPLRISVPLAVQGSNILDNSFIVDTSFQ